MRTILAEIAKIFDPLGLLGPILVAARLIMQDCWRHQVEWDQQLPINIKSAWADYAADFNNITSISDDWGIIPANTVDLQLHGFADASEKAYGACIYLRCITISGNIQTRLLCAKTKVAPLQNDNLARLELCAALMLAHLYEAEIPRSFFWSDSTIVLHWINTPSYQLKTFVANRVADIQTKTQASTWRHVRSKDNPADEIYRGQTPTEFLNNSLWNYGPACLNKPESDWPTSIISPAPAEDKEKRKFTCLTTCIKGELLDDSFIKSFKTTNHLHRVIARSLRWSPHNKYIGEFTSTELQEAQTRLVHLIQTIAFPKDIHNLKHEKYVEENSILRRLSPFLDGKNQLMRVSGRLDHANISYDQKHPMILPANHPYTTLIIQDTHERNFHSGIQSTLYAIRRKFWPINIRNETRKYKSMDVGDASEQSLKLQHTEWANYRENE